jgi:hypothetical protein
MPTATAGETDRLLTYAGKPCVASQVRGTLAILRYYREFLASDCEKGRDPEDRHWENVITKEYARQRLAFLIHVAINRKAGIPDITCRRQDAAYQHDLHKDCADIRNYRRSRIRPWGLNGRRFRTDVIQERFGYFLDRDDD